MSVDTPVTRIDHVEVFVPNVEEAATWYETTLGLRPAREFLEWGVGNGPVMIAADGNNSMIALWEGEPQGDHDSRGLHRLAFGTDAPDFLNFIDRIGSDIEVFDSQGCRLSRLEPVDHGLMYSLYFCDPYGNRLELTTADYDAVREGLPDSRIAEDSA